jgi:hypothetical protein
MNRKLETNPDILQATMRIIPSCPFFSRRPGFRRRSNGDAWYLDGVHR